MSELKIKVEGGKEHIVHQISEKVFTLDGHSKELDLVRLKDGKFNLILNHASYNIDLVEADYSTKSFTIAVNGNNYSLKVEDRFDLLLQQLGMDDLASAGITEIKAPMPGLVLSIAVEIGQEVKTGEALIVLEAMKMENVLKSPGDLTVKSIAVKPGQAVEKNQLLIEFEG